MKSNTQKLQELREKMRNIYTPMKEEERRLEKLVENEKIEERKSQFEKIKGKIFILPTHPYRGDGMIMRRVVSCDEFFTDTNSCKVEKMEICWFEYGDVQVYSGTDTCRVSSLINEPEATEDDIFTFKSKLSEVLNDKINSIKSK